METKANCGVMIGLGQLIGEFFSKGDHERAMKLQERTQEKKKGRSKFSEDLGKRRIREVAH